MSSFQPHIRQTPAAGMPGGPLLSTSRSSDGRNRVMLGVPTAGQFAAERHSEDVISLNLAPAPQPAADISIPRQVFASVRSLIGGTVRDTRGRSMQERPYDRPRAHSTRAKVAAAGLLVAVTAGAGYAGMNAVGQDRHDQQAAACQTQPVKAATASFMSVPMKGSGGSHGSSSHGSSSHGSSSHGSSSHGSSSHSTNTETGHAGGSAGGHVSSPSHIPTSGAPLRNNYTPAPNTNGGSLAPYILLTQPHASGPVAPAQQCAPGPASSNA